MPKNERVNGCAAMVPTIQSTPDLCPRCGQDITPPGTPICHTCYLDILEGFVDEATTTTPTVEQG